MSRDIEKKLYKYTTKIEIKKLANLWWCVYIGTGGGHLWVR